ncbi:transketolase family protein [Acidaminobacter sp. JC074]|uniref:transketolase family protein n=1 Tax=Acidaminobacter sp. JC074 TaxID=2530199 RepID=UPI001F0E40B8|nr:transketolase C-terminal domain-containing protein [Acidaminobacter sp. JC074]MCH4886151.1 transketolase family protein [Acidaminobacter sp. JC074]
MGKATRQAYGEELEIIMHKNNKVVVFDADLSKSTKTFLSSQSFPDRHFNMGIAEANMICVAAGFAASGYTAFASSFAMFASGRAWEQIRNSVAYPNLNVNICATHAGISVGEDGVSHQAIEDIAIMKAIANMEIYCPCDDLQTRAVINHVADTPGPSYVRLGRSGVEDVYNHACEFNVKKADLILEGHHVLIIATGLMVQESLKACEILKDQGINASLVNVCCIKPLDNENLIPLIKAHNYIFTCEEHNIIGGLGESITSLASEYCPSLIKRIGMQDCFAESGPFGKLLDKYNLNGEKIAKTIGQFLKERI